MSTVAAWRCDHRTHPDYPAPGWTGPINHDRIECCASSRNATTAVVVAVLAERDGWAALPDGRHLCPVHAQPQEAVA